MILKKVFVISTFSFLFIAGNIDYIDPIAFRSGELVAELTFEAWVQYAQQKREMLLSLAQKIGVVGVEYATRLNRSFLNGYKSALENKNVMLHLEHAQVTNFQAALVLSAHYYWVLQLSKALDTRNFECTYDENFEKEALEGQA